MTEPATAATGLPPARPRSRRVDAAFRRGTGVSAAGVLVVFVAVAAFLVQKAVPALTADHASFLTERQWLPDAEPATFGIAALALGTVVTSVVALLIAVPVAIGVALFISEYAP